MPLKDPAKAKAYHAAYYLKHRERERNRNRNWYLKNRPTVIAYVANWRKNNPGRRSAEHRTNRYAITQADYDRMSREQNGLCAICQQTPIGKPPMHVLHVDHDHDTGHVRALLCHRCNKGLGAFKDDLGLLSKAFLYLLRFKRVAEVA